MSVDSIQKSLHDFVIGKYKKYLPKDGEMHSLYQNGWFEDIYAFQIQYLNCVFNIQVFAHIDIFDWSSNMESSYGIVAQLGFRIPYKKEVWKENQMQTSMFTIAPDDVWDMLTFTYKGCQGVNASNGCVLLNDKAGLIIEQFLADVSANLNQGMYRQLIAAYNGVGVFF